MRLVGKILRELAGKTGVSVLGPAPAPFAGLRGERRFQCLLKSDNWPSIRSLYAELLSIMGKSILRVSLDLDPVNML